MSTIGGPLPNERAPKVNKLIVGKSLVLILCILKKSDMVLSTSELQSVIANEKKNKSTLASLFFLFLLHETKLIFKWCF